MRLEEIYDNELGVEYKHARDLYLKSGEYVGYIRLVMYESGNMAIKYPQLEYEIEEEYRNRGIMSEELPKYLQFVFLEGEEVIVALCKENNSISKKLLERNQFFNAGKIRDKIIFVLFKKFYEKKIRGKEWVRTLNKYKNTAVVR